MSGRYRSFSLLHGLRGGDRVDVWLRSSKACDGCRCWASHSAGAKQPGDASVRTGFAVTHLRCLNSLGRLSQKFLPNITRPRSSLVAGGSCCGVGQRCSQGTTNCGRPRHRHSLHGQIVLTRARENERFVAGVASVVERTGFAAKATACGTARTTVASTTPPPPHPGASKRKP